MLKKKKVCIKKSREKRETEKEREKKKRKPTKKPKDARGSSTCKLTQNECGITKPSKPRIIATPSDIGSFKCTQQRSRCTGRPKSRWLGKGAIGREACRV